MSNPYINPSVKCAVRWYRRPEQRNRHTIDCQEPEGQDLCPYALIFPSQQILPFQLIAGVEGTYGQSAPTSWHIRDLNGTVVQSLSAFLLDLAVEQFTGPNRDYIILDEPITLTTPLADGLYEMTIGTAGGTYYSETFRICADTESCFHRLTWTSCGDIGTQRYAFREFTNIAYFPREKAHIGRAVPEIKQETEEDATSKDVPVLSRKVVRWNMEIEDMPWFLADALTEIPLHDTVTLRLAGETGEDTIEDVSAVVAWPEKETCLAIVTFTFQADEASLVSGCCDSFDVACPTPCIEADGVAGVHDPVVGEVFLLNRGQYGTFYGIGEPEARDGLGFGNYVACPQRFATTTQTGYEYVYFTNGEWLPAVYILDISGGDCTGTLHISGNMMGQFGAQFQWSEDLSTWTDIGPVFDSASLGSGVDLVDVPDEANYIRIEMVGSECTAATSTPIASPCIDGVDLTYSTGGLNFGVVSAFVQDDGRVVVGGAFTLFLATTTNRMTRLLSDGTIDAAYRAALPGGMDAVVKAVAQDSSGRAIAVGAFTTAGGNTAGKIARIGTTGAFDATFVTGTGFNGVQCNGMLILSNGTILVVGDFTSYNGTAKNRIIGLKTDGTIETAFAVGAGFDGSAERIALCPDGTILVSSRFFTTYQGNTVRAGAGTATIVRINADGTYNSTVALSSDPSDKYFNGSIRGITVQPNGKIIVTGEFTNYNGTAVNRIARLNPDGTLDTAFTTANGAGFNDWTMKSTVLPDGRILVGIYTYATTTFDGVNVYGLACLNPDGSLDTSFDIGTGFDGTTEGTIALGTSSVLVHGGFDNADGVARKKVARIIL